MKTFSLAAGPAAAIALGWSLWDAGDPQSPAQAWTAGVTLLCAAWWMFEPIPIPATSLLPLALFPLAGVLTADQVASAYGDKLILLLLGGLMLSTALQRSGAHRRLALSMVRAFGGRGGRGLVLGVMVAAAGLSMWISNMATALMLLPIVTAVVEKTPDPKLRTALLLGMAYATSIGGIGTPVGTPPNLIFIDNYYHLTGIEIGFSRWMSWTVPIVLLMIPLAALWLTRGIAPGQRIELPETGPWRPVEVRTLAVFLATALLWVTRSEPWGGWSAWCNLPEANDATVALLAVVAMFLIPDGRGDRLLDWETAQRIPWGILILFAGGVAISEAFAASGLSRQLGVLLAGLADLPVLPMIVVLCLGVTFLTEVTSNTATANLLMPILGAAAAAARVDPLLFMAPAAISVSFAFMLPVATGPNAIVFGSPHVTVQDMAREGLVLNLIGVVVVAGLFSWRFVV
jgi:sodium-dependent dicarboxylate transporter 2/3/5